MKIFVTILISISWFQLYAQIDSFNSDLKRNVSFLNSLKKEEKKSKLNFYLNEDWYGGVVFTTDSSVINGCTFKYNIYTDQMEMRTLINPKTVEFLSIGSKKFIYTEYITSDSLVFEGYFELILNGDCKLLVRREVLATMNEEELKIYGSSGSNRITKILYVKKDNEPALKVNRSKNFFMDYLSDKEKMASYFNKRFSFFKSEKGIISLINYYNKI